MTLATTTRRVPPTLATVLLSLAFLLVATVPHVRADSSFSSAVASVSSAAAAACPRNPVDGDRCIFHLPDGLVRGVFRAVQLPTPFASTGAWQITVPYAKPFSQYPFQAPQPVEAWGPIVLAGDQGPAKACYQANPTFNLLGQMLNFTNGVSVDCGYSTWYVPHIGRPRRNGLLQTRVMFHGGGFIGGAGGGQLDAAYLAAKTGKGYVLPEYRIDIFGFALVENSSMPANLGLRDQEAALWSIKRNAIGFGLDPVNMAIAGQSAGAMSDAIHMCVADERDPHTNYLHKLGIENVMIHSPAQPIHNRPPTMYAKTAYVLSNLGCPTSADAGWLCLQRQTATQLAAANAATASLMPTTPFAPVVGGPNNRHLPKQPFAMQLDMLARERRREPNRRFRVLITRTGMEAGASSNIPCCGLTNDTLFNMPYEWTQGGEVFWGGFFDMAAALWSAEAATKIVNFYNNATNGFIKPVMAPEDWYLLFEQMVSDAFVHGFWYASAERMSQGVPPITTTSGLKVWAWKFKYRWQHTFSPEQALQDGHGSDMTAIFQVPLQPVLQTSIDAVDQQEIDEVTSYFDAFMDGEDLPWSQWPYVRVIETPGVDAVEEAQPDNEVRAVHELWAGLMTNPPGA